MSVLYTADGQRLIDAETGKYVDPFIPGVSMPFYTPTSDFTGAKNVGAFGQLQPYTGPIVNGVAQLTDGAVYENIRFDCIVEARSPVMLKHCMIVNPKTYIDTTDTVKGVFRALNGSNTDNIVLENVEIHNRAQRSFNGVVGRNVTMRRTVITGALDPLSESAGGSAPTTSGKSFTVSDSWFGAVAWWYSRTINPDVHGSDPYSHSDVTQKSSAALRQEFFNSVLGAYADSIIGTGTPGAGSDTGNTFVPGSGYNYIETQAQQNQLRDQYLAFYSDPGQSMYGQSHRLTTPDNGSLAAVMLNKGNALFTKCWLGGGTATVNALDASLPTTIPGGFIDCTFFNDMVNGHTSQGVFDATRKGHAVLLPTGKNFESWSGNEWFDGSPVTITRT